jgi:hypothetical protein
MQICKYICIVCVYVISILRITCLHVQYNLVLFLESSIRILAVMNACLGDGMRTGKSVFRSYLNKIFALDFQTTKKNNVCFPAEESRVLTKYT